MSSAGLGAVGDGTLVSLRRLLEVFRPSTVAACAVRTWKSVHYFLLASYFAVSCPAVGVQGIGFFGRCCGAQCLA